MDNEKIVDFHEWCPKCKHFDLEPDEEPCWGCQGVPVRINSTKPEMFEEDPNARKA